MSWSSRDGSTSILMIFSSFNSGSSLLSNPTFFLVHSLSACRNNCSPSNHVPFFWNWLTVCPLDALSAGLILRIMCLHCPGSEESRISETRFATYIVCCNLPVSLWLYRRAILESVQNTTYWNSKSISLLMSWSTSDPITAACNS